MYLAHEGLRFSAVRDQHSTLLAVLQIRDPVVLHRLDGGLDKVSRKYLDRILKNYL